MPAAPASPPLPPPPTVAITGAGGALGQALLRRWHARGARLIALSHSERPIALEDGEGRPIPLQQRRWQVGDEEGLCDCLEQVDVLVLNHGINVHGARTAEAVERSLQVNALSTWRLLELFAGIAAQRAGAEPGRRRAEVWINTSEAEIQPALSPLYEISKRLLGQLLSLRAVELGNRLRLRRLVLGPFRSELNPIGVMDADWVAGEILRQVDWNCSLIVVTVNPLTYVLMPLTTLLRWVYVRACSRPEAQVEIRNPGR